MKILQMNITDFGCMKDRIIEPSESLNIIYGENESGKSTVLLFIKFMLYGLTRRSATNSERERSISWDNHRAAGTMTVSFEGKSYRIERSFTENGRGGSERLSIIRMDDGSIVNTAKSPGEFFLGIPREAFEGSACVGQMRSADINGEKVASSIENMLSAADESVDTAKILKGLDGVRVTYRHKNKTGGSLYEDEIRINQLRGRIDKAKEDTLALERWEQKLEQSRDEYAIVKKDFEQKDALLGELNKVTVIKRFEKLRDTRAELDALYEKKKACEGELDVDGFMPDRAHTAELRLVAKAFAEARKQYDLKKDNSARKRAVDYDSSAAELGEEIERLGGKSAVMDSADRAAKKIKAQKALIALSVSIASIVALGGLAVTLFWSILGAIGFAAIPIAVIVSVIATKNKKKAAGSLTQICEHYNSDYASLETRLDYCASALLEARASAEHRARADAELIAAAENLDEKQKALGEIIRRTQNGAPETLEMAAIEFKRLDGLISERENILRETAALERAVSEESEALCHYDEDELRKAVSIDLDSITPVAIAEAERIRGFLAEKLRIVSERISALENTVMGLRATVEDPLPLCDSLAELEEKHRQDGEFYDALTLAMESIESAADAMRGSVTPVISRQASELMDKLSGGKYPVLRTTSALGVSLDKDGYAVKSDLLSSGTRDTAYLSLRLALFMRIFEGELPPLIFDESLCQLDDTRAGRMLALLGRLSDEGIQTLLFTSHSRENRILDEQGIEYNAIIL
ncbi:MAG: AAA family ATPase [Clostridia bacterium]|nr:AAA family ATPase [Clostridia bacterium]